MNIYKHIVFNPHITNIEGVINLMGGHSVYSLHSVLPVTEYEWVAVFEAWDGTLSEEDVFGKKLVGLNDKLVEKST